MKRTWERYSLNKIHKNLKKRDDVDLSQFRCPSTDTNKSKTNQESFTLTGWVWIKTVVVQNLTYIYEVKHQTTMKIGGVVFFLFVGCIAMINAISKSSNDGKILSSCGKYIPGKLIFFFATQKITIKSRFFF